MTGVNDRIIMYGGGDLLLERFSGEILLALDAAFVVFLIELYGCTARGLVALFFFVG